MLYHVSSTSGIKVLEPKKSSHGEAYVYALKNLTTALLFGAKKDDFDFLMDENEQGIPVIYECYPKAFETVYKGKSCSIYELSEDGFIAGMTNWEPELVSTNPVAVLNEIRVDDLYERLLYEAKQGKLIIHYFQDELSYKKIVSEHIVDRLIRWDLLESDIIYRDKRFSAYFADLIKALKDVLSGRYL